MPRRNKQKASTQAMFEGKETTATHILQSSYKSDASHQQPEVPMKDNRQAAFKTRKKMYSKISLRSSPRLQADSAYDGDAESSPSATQSDGDDPYCLATMEEVPAVVPKNKKRGTKQTVLRKTKKSKNKSDGKILSRSNKRASTTSSGHPSSTPNAEVPVARRRSTRRNAALNTTPEVTPILPLRSLNSSPTTPHIVEQNISTPQLYQLVRGQKSSSPITTTSGSSLLVSSQADSGIAVSPPTKRARIQTTESRTKTANVLGKKFMNRRNIFSPKSKSNEDLKDASEKPSSVSNNSCFGFDSSNPQPRQQLKENRKKPKIGLNSLKPSSKETSKPSERKVSGCTTYRNKKPVTSDSSPASTSRPLASTDSENWLDRSLKSPWASPDLFSDDMFSADSDSYAVNKTNSKNYNTSKEKKLKPKKSVTKFESWVKEKNMEIEYIETFDLNIE